MNNNIAIFEEKKIRRIYDEKTDTWRFSVVDIIQVLTESDNPRRYLSDFWRGSGVKEGKEYAALTNIIHEEWADVSIKDHKALKGITTQNLRDHMTEAELIFTALAELSTRSIAASANAQGFEENKEAGKKGGQIAKGASLELENKTGQKVVTRSKPLSMIDEE